MTTNRARRSIASTMARAGGMVLVAGLLAGFGLAPTIADAKAPTKVAICHATSSTSNPYIKLLVRASSLDGKGKNDHTGHNGGLFDFSDPASNNGWGDIIPDAEGVAFSMNATEDGLRILSNGCNGPQEGSCPDGSNPVGGGCSTEETCPSGQPATGGECPDDDEEIVLCDTDPELTADDPACGVDEGVEGDGDEIVPCDTDPELSADDPACGVEGEVVEGDGEEQVPACETDAELSADDPLCGVEEEVVEGDGEACPTDASLAADDPSCTAVDELPVDPTDVDGTPDDGETPADGQTPDEGQTPRGDDGGSDQAQTPTGDDGPAEGSGIEVLGSVTHAHPHALPVTGSDSLVLAAVGVVLVALGMALAIWARLSRA